MQPCKATIAPGQEAPEVATGGLVAVVGAVPDRSCEPEPVVAAEVVVAGLACVAAVLCMLVATATAPRVLAAPAPRVMAEIQVSALLRVSDLAGKFLFSLFMRPRSSTRLSILWAHPLSRL
jgi:hypothetical protein